MIFNHLLFLALFASAVHGQGSSTTASASASASVTTTASSKPSSAASSSATGNSTASATSPASAPNATPSITPCITTCATEAQSPETCAKFTNVSCVCTNTAYQQKIGACLKANCTAADQAIAGKIQGAECGTGGGNSSSTAAPSSSTSAKSGAAIRQMQLVGNGNVLSAMMAVFGAVVGLAAVL